MSHADQCSIDGAVAVGMVLTKYFTYHTGTFLVRLVAEIANTAHSEEDTAVYGLESIAYIGEGTGYDD